MTEYNRIIRYRINDKQYFIDLFRRDKWSEEKITTEMSGKKYLNATLTLYGYERENGSKFFDHYELTDENGQKIDINDLNGYEHDEVLSDCFWHFNGSQADIRAAVEIIKTAQKEEN